MVDGCRGAGGGVGGPQGEHQGERMGSHRVRNRREKTNIHSVSK